MLKLTEKDISYLRTLLGYSLQSYSSTRLSIYNKYALSCDGILALSFSKVNQHKNIVLKVGDNFFETNWGKMYYDYSIEYEDRIINNAEVHLGTSPIIKIDVYGKKYDGEEFKAFPDIYCKHKDVLITDEVFVFMCRNGETIIVAFDGISPSIEVWHYNNIEHYVTHDDDEPYILNHSVNVHP